MKIFDETMQHLERRISYSSTRNDMINNNIANIDTPYYKAKDVVFKDVLQEALTDAAVAKRTHPKHLPFTPSHAPFQIVSQKGTMFNHNGNNVDIDKEMAELAKNQIYYRTLVDRLNNKFSQIQTVVRGGK